MASLLSYQVWLELPLEIRLKVAAEFKIPRTIEREVYGAGAKAVVVRDGFTPQSLIAISVESLHEKLGEYLEDTDDFYKLWQGLLLKIEGKLPINKVEEEKIDQDDNVQQEKPAKIDAPAKKRAGRPRKGSN